MKKILAGTISLILIVSTPLMSDTSFLSETEAESPLKKNSSNSIVHELQNTYHGIYNEYKDSVVFISTEKTVNVKGINPFTDDPVFREFFGLKNTPPKTRKAKGLGTGFIISNDGYICTNHHVVQNVDTVTVTVSSKSYEAQIIGSDAFTDIALLKIKGGGKFKPVHFGNSDDVKVGDIVVAIGNPFGLDKTYTSGIVSATGRNQLDPNGNVHIQTDTAINQGNSGGPLINIDGEVIGVNRAIYSSTGGNVGIGFAIPINNTKETLIEIKKYGKVRRGFIGISIAPLSADHAKKLGLKNSDGVLVGGIIKNGPAHKSGIAEGDVILKIDGSEVKDGIALVKNISTRKIGSTVRLSVWRNKTLKDITVAIKERP
ncbi:MAG TPA: trypsin-like peptidase domain-containing protein [Spirochaetota bacterium]|nr:trypsin-like peptidase domain-containing protein [Spirochaetota bacterium]HPF05057.1 trypsin-like peptidase domain-containing protein [Spirochaetota bacterium]HPJ41166.1 trypsin-like peptidase domain-containing protein [Spirochaetota bacterium]HPR38930.1 trypsin-like peptidase domain-containing protein [Spirochaetota bacterium]HRX47594.1 trypsin-like peptidase domain-containing protein [Spirochaetota bacterium]